MILMLIEKFDLLGAKIVQSNTDGILIKIKKKAAQKKKGPNIGFIGNKQNSLAYKQLIEAGLKEDEDFANKLAFYTYERKESN